MHPKTTSLPSGLSVLSQLIMLRSIAEVLSVISYITSLTSYKISYLVPRCIRIFLIGAELCREEEMIQEADSSMFYRKSKHKNIIYIIPLNSQYI